MFSSPGKMEVLFKPPFYETCSQWVLVSSYHTLSHVRLGTIQSLYHVDAGHAAVPDPGRPIFVLNPLTWLISKKAPSVPATPDGLYESLLSKLGRKFIQFARGYYQQEPGKTAGDKAQPKTSPFAV